MVSTHVVLLALVVFSTSTVSSFDHPNWRLVNANDCGQRGPRSPDVLDDKPAGVAQFPWSAELEVFVHSTESHSRRKHLCSGSLITPKFVLTAAHCLIPDRAVKRLSFTVNEVKVGVKVKRRTLRRNKIAGRCAQTDQERIDVKRVIAHPGFHSDLIDIALVELDNAVGLNDCVNTVCLPRPIALTRRYEDIEAVIVEEATGGPLKSAPAVKRNRLPNVKIPIVDCIPSKVQARTSRLVCAAAKEKFNGCKVEAGSPGTVVEDNARLLIGVGSVEAGAHCTASSPVIFTDIRYFMEWILDNINE